LKTVYVASKRGNDNGEKESEQCRVRMTVVFELSEKVWNFRFGTWRGRETGRADQKP